jgi:imidazolonepropionase
MISADFVLRNAGALVTPRGPAPRRGESLGRLDTVERGAVAASGGRLVFVGPERDLEGSVSLAGNATVLDADGAAVVPGLVDPHTHVVFAGDRDDEIRARLAGITYAEIAAAGGGIVRSVDATRRASREELVSGLVARLDEMMLQGTTTVEVKSGYGLETRTELLCLEVVAEVGRTHPMTVVPTFLGAHEVPLEHRGARRRYLDLIVGEMIPEVARRRLAAFCDVFCEEGVFTVAESREVLSAARAHGLSLRLHADELAATGGAELAAEMGARSADHLLHVSQEGIHALSDTGCAATLLPAAAFYLRLGRYAPARALVAAGVPVALATDANPGGGLSPSMPFVMAVACFSMGLSLEEALAAATINAAYSLGLEEDVGSLEVGKRADLVVLRSRRLLDLVRVGAPAIRAVVKDGRVIVRDGRRLET